MTSGGSVSNGRMEMPTTLKSLTTTKKGTVKRLPNIHPGEILLEEFLKPLNITGYRLSKETHMPATRVSDIIRKKRGITADTAMRLSRYFGNSPDFWLGLQAEFELREEERLRKKEFDSIIPWRKAAAV
jgi:addiction module HigA family antidote